MFLEGINWNGWMDRQWHIVPKRRGTRVKCSSTWIGLDSGDRQTNSPVWSLRMGREWCSKHGVKIDRLFFMNSFVGQQTDLEQYSKFINQSINQSNFYSANIPGKARLSGATAKSVFNSKIEETGNQWRERSSGTLRVNRGDFVTMRASRFWIRWSLQH